MKPQAIIFDCDGTLVDSESVMSEVYARLLAAEGLPMTGPIALDRFRGRRLAETMAEVAAELGRPLSADFEDQLRDGTADALRAGIREMEGALALVEALTIPFCVASNAPRAKVELSLGLTGMLSHFAGRVFTAYEVNSWKPDPGLFLHAAAALGVAPARCLVIEDSLPGVLAGRNAGMQVLALLPHGPVGWLPEGVPTIGGLAEVARVLAGR